MAQPGVVTYNLGTGEGYSVLNIVEAFEEVARQQIPYQIVARRPGDAATVYADVSKAERELGWSAEKNLADICRDCWRWQQQNPNGYEEA
jgi:UDP-glucose 4-epimerase